MDKQQPNRVTTIALPEGGAIAGDARDQLAPAVAQLYASAEPRLRVDLLRVLLRPVGPLALAGIAAGAFAALLPRTRWQGALVSIDSIAGIGSDAVIELVRYVEQKSPELLLRLPEMLGESSGWMATASGAVLLLALRAWSHGDNPRLSRGTTP